MHTIPQQTAHLILSPGRIDLPCSAGCTLIADPYRGFVVSTPTLIRGNPKVSVPIPPDPSLSGINVYAQWVVGGGSGCLGFDMSNALRIRIK